MNVVQTSAGLLKHCLYIELRAHRKSVLRLLTMTEASAHLRVAYSQESMKCSRFRFFHPLVRETYINDVF